MYRKNRAERIGWSALMVALLCLGVLGSADVTNAADRIVLGELFTADW